MIENDFRGRVRQDARICPDHLAARLIRDAARALEADKTVVVDHRRCREVAARLDFLLAEARTTRAAIMAASPAIIERSGHPRTIVEMIEAEPTDADYQFRLAKLLLRALDWF